MVDLNNLEPILGLCAKTAIMHQCTSKRRRQQLAKEKFELAQAYMLELPRQQGTENPHNKVRRMEDF